MKQLHHDSWLVRAATLAVSAFGMMLLLTACGLLSPSSAIAPVARVVGFDPPDTRDNQMQIRDGLRKDGWIEGQNFVFEWHLSADPTGIKEWLPALEADAARGQPVVLISAATTHALALKQATSTIPIVVAIGDPVTLGLASSYAHPRGNLTGVSTSPFSQASKRIDVLKEVLPNVRHLGVLYSDPANPNLASLDSFGAAAKQLGMDMVAVQTGKRVEEFDAAFALLDRAQVDALYVVQDVVTNDHLAELAALATRHRMATMCTRSIWVRQGYLMSYASQVSALFSLQADYVDRILRGARHADLPIQLPTVFDVSVNVKTLQALGLTVAPSALPLVTEWIQ